MTAAKGLAPLQSEAVKVAGTATYNPWVNGRRPEGEALAGMGDARSASGGIEKGVQPPSAGAHRAPEVKERLKKRLGHL